MDERKSSLSDLKSHSNLDDPPYSRLFIIGGKQLSEEDFRAAFSKFGVVEEIWIVKDRQTGERKGVTYIKFSKTSEAAKAMEAMNGKVLGNSNNRPIKVMVASSRDKGSTREPNEEEKVLRLFVMIPKTMTDTELYDVFKQYGDIDYASIIRDRDTRESKGVAYVKYYKFSHAAIAFEQCDRRYKAVFAEPRKPNAKTETSMKSSSIADSFGKTALLLPPTESTNDTSYTKLQVVASPSLNQDQLWKLFDIVPSMDFCHVRMENRSHTLRATVVYSNPQWAAYACEKFHGFEYPPGQRLIVKPEYDPRTSLITKHTKQPDILQIAETITQASNLIQAAGLSPDILQAKLGLAAARRDNSLLCSVNLPDPKPLANIDDTTVARCFIVCNPQPPPLHTLRDVFCRFGDLIDVYMLANRNCGYAKYASREAAQNAIKVLHGCEVFGIRIKVIEAEEKPERKRIRLDDGET